MHWIEVLTPGMHTTVQDLGRPGFQRYGVPIGGAMDTRSLRLANQLVGNPVDLAGLELTLVGGRFRLPARTVVALTGADFNPQWIVENQPAVPFPQGRPVVIEEGGELLLGSSRAGCRCYLAVAGGIDVPVVMGSRATYSRASLGGWEGRPLRAGDKLPVGTFFSTPRWAQLAKYPTKSGLRFPRCYVQSDSVAGERTAGEINPVVTLRIVLGQHFPRLQVIAQQRLWNEVFTVTPQSDRMGYRLSGPDLPWEEPWTMLSSGVVRGTLQLPFGGQPILLMADGAPTGGYPRIGHVIAADWPLAGQLSPGERIRFREVTLPEARTLWQTAEQTLHDKIRGMERELER